MLPGIFDVGKVFSLHLTNEADLQRDVQEDDAEVSTKLLFEVWTQPANVQSLGLDSVGFEVIHLCNKFVDKRIP